MKALIVIFLAIVTTANAQTGANATIHGVITGRSSEALNGVSIKVIRAGAFLCDTLTDIEGKYSIHLPPDSYIMKITYPGYTTIVITDINLVENPNCVIDMKMSLEDAIKAPSVCSCCRLPLINLEPGNTGTTITGDQIRRKN